MKNFYFYDNESGEEFIVEAETLDEAWEVAKDYFADPTFDSEISDYEAEMMGLDTY